MRLWTLHPKYLDARGLVALWREALLAQKVLLGATRGYKHHPQLRRFSGLANPPAALASYLAAVHEEAVQRGYKFDASKIGARRIHGKLKETRGQLLYEWRHLKRKLKKRDPKKHRDLLPKKIPAPHPLFRIVPGGVQDWERVRWVNNPFKKSSSVAAEVTRLKISPDPGTETPDPNTVRASSRRLPLL